MEDRSEKIISLIRIKGPVVPSQLSSEIGVEPLFASAMLSELASKKRLVISHLKVGSSPLYYLPEQKNYLENYTKNLNHKEKEAFELLKENKILEDSKLEPAIRVAMRSIKDFAVPIQVSQNDREIIFWRIYSIANEEAIPSIREMLKKQEVIPARKEPEKEAIKPAEDAAKSVKIPKKKSKMQVLADEEKKIFLERIASFAKNSKIDIVAEIKIKKKDEAHMIVSLDSSLGKLDYLLIAKNKESISNKDLMNAYKKGKTAKMPVLFLTDGQMTGSSEKYAKSLKSHLIVRKLSP